MQSSTGVGPGTKLVAVVHGVGDQEAGATVDSLVSSWGASQTQPPAVRRELLWLEDEAERAAPAVHTFPCHVRRVGSIVFAEVFWADLSRVRRGALSVGRSLIQLLFELEHVGDAAARQTRDTGRLYRSLCHVPLVALRGPIAAINLVLGVTAALLAFSTFLTGGLPGDLTTSSLFLLTGILSLLGGLLLYRRNVYWRPFSISLASTGVLVAASMSSSHLAQSVTWRLRWEEFLVRVIWSEGSRSSMTPMEWGGANLLVLLNLVWLVVWGFVAVLIVAWVFECISRKEEARRSATVAYLVTGVAIWLWSLAIPTLWAMAWPFLPDGLLPATFLEYGVKLMGLHWTLAVVVALVFIGSWVWSSWFHRSPRLRRYVHDSPRLLVSLPLQATLATIAPLSLAVTVLLVVSDLSGGFEPGSWAGTMVSYLENGNEIAILAAGLLGLLGVALSRPLQVGLDIAQDVLGYFRALPGRGYFTRKRILKRLKRVLSVLIEAESPDELAIVSHSQGTMAAIEVFKDTELLRPIPLDKRTLVTMGSPFKHLYQHYFSGDFVTAPRKEPGGSLWLNIFRRDDFVGTEVTDNKSWPERVAVSPRGHTGYWSDRQVLAGLKTYGVL